MDVTELNNNQLEELRDKYFHELLDAGIVDFFCAEDIPMSNVIANYEGTYFVDDDFFSSAEL